MMNDRIIQALNTANAQYGTPFYLFDEAQLKLDYEQLRNHLPSSVSLYYSMKANPNPVVIQHLLKWSAQLEIASIGEFHRAIELGADVASIVFTGPGKTVEDMEICLRKGIGIINVEHLQELAVVEQVAAKLSMVASITLRLNLSLDSTGSRMAAGGGASPFGIDEECIDEAVSIINKCEHLKLVGIHTHQGTQNFSIEYYEQATERMLYWYRKLHQVYQFQLTTLGLGGGYGVPTFIEDEPFSIEMYEQMLKQKLNENADLEIPNVFIESGRYIVSRMGYFVSSVLYEKQSKDKNYLIIDGGTNQRAGLGRTFKKPLPLLKVSADGQVEISGEQPNSTSYTIVGPLCTPMDIMQSGVDFAEVHQGDLIVFSNSGAYGLTYANVHFLSHRLPPELLLTQDGTLRDISLISPLREESMTR
ncbi:alanine racemase [Paenibacillus assamensis]|uniref:alanine racemase n=1 Tax=Paenibacillus assamensis TaxID=311244 RepID=UPI0004077D7E|nr:alanine racemase [Paenibacillus assamensis]